MGRPRKTPATLREVRDWGRKNGYTVGQRGVMSRALLDDFVKKTGRPIGRVQQPETR